jgi:hypothetical protein
MTDSDELFVLMQSCAKALIFRHPLTRLAALIWLAIR